MHLLDQVLGSEQVGLASARAATADIDAGGRAVAGDDRGRTRAPTPSDTLIVTDGDAGDVGQRSVRVDRAGGRRSSGVIGAGHVEPRVPGWTQRQLACPIVLDRTPQEPTLINRLRSASKRATGEVVHWAWETAVECAAIGAHSRRGRRFGKFGPNSVICFPANAIFNEEFIHIGTGTMIGPHVTLSAGMVPGQECISNPVVSIGDRCLIGKGSGIVGHLEIVIGNDVWTGHNVYITDQNHDYRDVTIPMSKQSMPEQAVRILSLIHI